MFARAHTRLRFKTTATKSKVAVPVVLFASRASLGCRCNCVRAGGKIKAPLRFSSLFQSAFGGQKSGGGARRTCFPRSGHFASVVCPLIPFVPFFLFSCMRACGRGHSLSFKMLVSRSCTRARSPAQQRRVKAKRLTSGFRCSDLKVPYPSSHLCFSPEAAAGATIFGMRM